MLVKDNNMVYIALMLGMSHVTLARNAKIYFLKCRGYLIKSHSSFVNECEFTMYVIYRLKSSLLFHNLLNDFFGSKEELKKFKEGFGQGVVNSKIKILINY